MQKDGVRFAMSMWSYLTQMCLCNLRYHCGGRCVGAMAATRVMRLVSLFALQLMVSKCSII